MVIYPTRFQRIYRKVADTTAGVYALAELVFFVGAILFFAFMAIRAVQPALSLIATTSFIGGFTICAVRRGWIAGSLAVIGVVLGFVGYAMGPIYDVTLPPQVLLTSQLVWGAGVLMWFAAIMPCWQTAATNIASMCYAAQRRF